MNTWKNILAGSVFWRVLQVFSAAYQHSRLKRINGLLGRCFAHSVVLKNLLGKNEERQIYQHSLFYRVLVWLIQLLNGWFVRLSRFYQRAAGTSLVIKLIKGTGDRLVQKPLAVVGIFLLGFSAGYLVFNPGLYQLLLLAFIALVTLVFWTGETSLADLLENSHFCRLLKYLLE